MDEKTPINRERPLRLLSGMLRRRWRRHGEILTYSGRVPATVSWANVFTFSRMTWMPRSSEALSSSTLCLYSTGLGHRGGRDASRDGSKQEPCGGDPVVQRALQASHPYSSLAAAKMVEVFPVPGGP